MTDSRLIDPYRRHLNYLRISITDRCNLSCIYCMPRDRIPKLYHRDILRYEELLRLVRIGVGLGITKVRITGGEPLVRKGVYDFLAELTAIEGIADVSLTTNGLLLEKNIARIHDAGIRRINVSLDTLKRSRFREITGTDGFRQVWNGILEALDSGFDPVKINVVAMRGINEDELIDIAKLSLTYPLHIRFIEHMPIGVSRFEEDRLLLAPEIKRRISKLGDLIPIEKADHDGPAERFRFENGPGEIGIIRPLSHHFCDRCNRLRLTASGQLRPCLLSDFEVDLRGPLRKGHLDDVLRAVFFKAVERKPSRHCLAEEKKSGGVASQMCGIGG